MKYYLILAGIVASILLMGCPSTTLETTSTNTYSDQKELIPDDHTYETAIQSVQLYQSGVEESYPVLFLNTTAQLTLEFDELIPEDQRESDFTVEFVNCDADWNPTNVLPIEFFEGFSQQRIENFERSAFTKIPYVHYNFQFPRENESFKISGNYLVIAYRNNNRNDLILSRRFIIAERKISISPRYLLNGRVERIRMNEFSFDLTVGSSPKIYNPANDLYIKVLQNFRWDNYLVLGQPRFTRDNQYEYYLDLAKSFNSGNEYRRLDITSTRFYAEGIQDVEEKEDIYEIFLYKDDLRKQNIFLPRRDRNGSYRIGVSEWPNADLNADYVSTNFLLQSDEPIDGDVYVLGRFSDWQMRNQNKMTYNSDLKRYEGTVILKQGIYDYAYGVKRDGEYIIDESVFEGNHFESENFYTILVYFRAPGDRTDRVIGYQPINYYE